MKSKLLILGTMMACGIFALTWTTTRAAEHYSDMPTGGHKCYPGSSCDGDPNLSGSRNENMETRSHRNSHHMNNMNNMNHMNNTNGMNNMSHMNGTRGMNGNGRALRMDSVESFRGTVKSVSRVKYPDGTQIEAIIETDRGDMRVLLGPARMMDYSKVKIQVGDRVMIRGYEVTANGRTMIMASSIEKNGNVLELRDSRRSPMWNR